VQEILGPDVKAFRTRRKGLLMSVPGKNPRLPFLPVIGLSILVSSHQPASGTQTCRLERMWPTLEKPWYFNAPQGAATDSAGNVSLADTGNKYIQKFSSELVLLSKGGSYGSDEEESVPPA
jgi:hypothetical protein